MKKYFRAEKRDHKGSEKLIGKWSDGFANSKNGAKSKGNKPKKTDDIEFKDGTVLLIDENTECKSITGKVTLFAVEGCSLKVNGKKVI